MNINLPDNSILPQGFIYPNAFLKIVKLNLVDFQWWYVINEEEILIRIDGLRKRYPNRILIPFARRDDNDDIACFELDKGEEVQIIHDFASSGYEQRGNYKTFWEWFRAAIEEMINVD